MRSLRNIARAALLVAIFLMVSPNRLLFGIDLDAAPQAAWWLALAMAIQVWFRCREARDLGLDLYRSNIAAASEGSAVPARIVVAAALPLLAAAALGSAVQALEPGRSAAWLDVVDGASAIILTGALSFIVGALPRLGRIMAAALPALLHGRSVRTAGRGGVLRLH